MSQEIIKAAEKGDIKQLQFLFNKVSVAQINETNKNKQTALMIAAREGNVDCVIALIEAGADLDKQDSQGYTAMMVATINQHEDCLQVIIDAGAKINLTNEEFETAWHIANSCHFSGVEKILNKAWDEYDVKKLEQRENGRHHYETVPLTPLSL